MVDEIKVTGTFSLKVYEDGVLIQEYEDKNLVVKGGKVAILNILSAGSPGFFIRDIAFGNNATAPADSDTNISSAFVKPLIGYSIVVPDITFNFALGTGEANGLNIQEFGLMTNSAILFARKTGISVNKTPSISMTGAWKISLT